MARRKPTAKAEFVLFDVFYEDGSQTSNRKVPGDLLDGLEGDEPGRAFLEDQDREIGERSGKPRAAIKSFARVSERLKAAKQQGSEKAKFGKSKKAAAVG